MALTTKLPRFLFAISIALIGIQQFMLGDFIEALMPVPDLIAGRLLLVYSIGAVLIAAGVCIIANIKPRLAAILLGILLVLLFLVLHVPRQISNPYDPGVWTGAFEVLGIGGGAFVLAGTLPLERAGLAAWNNAVNRLIESGPYFFSSALVVIGIQHFMYADFIQGIIPSWVPQRLFLAYFVGVAFMATTASVILKINIRLSTALLGIMFFLFVALLHIPRVAANPEARNEWSSAFVAAAFCAISFILSGAAGKNLNFDTRRNFQ